MTERLVWPRKAWPKSKLLTSLNLLVLLYIKWDDKVV